MTCFRLMKEETKNEDYVPYTWENLPDVQMENKLSFFMPQRKEICSINWTKFLVVKTSIDQWKNGECMTLWRWKGTTSNAKYDSSTWIANTQNTFQTWTTTRFHWKRDDTQSIHINTQEGLNCIHRHISPLT